MLPIVNEVVDKVCNRLDRLIVKESENGIRLDRVATLLDELLERVRDDA
jgi:hypothetical protein